MNEILNKISGIIKSYQNKEYKDLFEMQRELSCNMFFLKEMQVEFNIQWNNEYHNYESKVNAIKQRHADKVVPELYACRKIYEGANNVFLSIGRELKMN
jgi:hypothetical protein